MSLTTKVFIAVDDISEVYMENVDPIQGAAIKSTVSVCSVENDQRHQKKRGAGRVLKCPGLTVLSRIRVVTF
jgi:hypothetical protein